MVLTTRYHALDAARFFAAFIVAMGHLLFSQSLITEYSNETVFLTPFRFGSLSVSFFFTLSGFVLAPQIPSIRQSPMKWLSARLVRLLPTYWFAWIIPMLIFVLLASRNGGPVLPNGFTSALLGVTATQSWTKSYLDLPNPPLWSLSVEVWLSLLLVIMALSIRKNVNVTVSSLYFLSLIVFDAKSSNAVLSSIHYFLLGILINNVKLLSFSKSTIVRICIAFILIFSFIPIYRDTITSDYSWLVVPCSAIFSCGVILIVATLEISQKWTRVSYYLGARSYSLYAVHFPILVFFTTSFPSLGQLNPIIYMLIIIVFICITTEMCYRMVERPSIDLSKRLKLNIK